MPLSYNNNTPQASQTVASTQSPILVNFQSIDSAFNTPVGGVAGGGNFCSYSFQATTTNFTAKPTNPIGVLSTVASTNGNPELAWINNTNATGAGPYNGVQLTGGGITAAAYCTFTVIGGVLTLTAGGYNVSGAVRNAQGDFTVTFARSFIAPGTNYIGMVTPSCTSVGGFAIKIASVIKTASTYRFTLQDQTNTFQDPPICDLVFFGVLV